MSETGMQAEDAKAKGKRYECRWKAAEDGSDQQVHYWVDLQPHEPHWPDSAVMRWDLRVNDWDRVWPELVDHPCAKLFAPRHPQREGPRKFSDWVESLPKGFEWERELPEHLHGAIRKALEEVGQRGDERPAVRAAVAEADERGAEDSVENDAGELLERLCALLIDLDEATAQRVSKNLALLALAPDSARTVEALRSDMKKAPSARMQQGA